MASNKEHIHTARCNKPDKWVPARASIFFNHFRYTEETRPSQILHIVYVAKKNRQKSTNLRNAKRQKGWKK